MDYVPETAIKIEQNGCNQMNPVPTMYLQQSLYQYDHAFVQREIKCLPKRRAQTCENERVKIPKRSTSHLSPRVYPLPGEYGLKYDISNSCLDRSIYVPQRDVQYCVACLATEMDVAVELTQEHFHSERYGEKPMDKLGAQKIAIGI